MAKPKATQASELDAFIAANAQGSKELPAAFMKDLAYFAKAANEGRVMSAEAMSDWARSKYGVAIGRTRLYNTVRSMGMTPWFSK